MLLTGHLLLLMYRLKMVKPVTREKKNRGSDNTSPKKDLSKPKIGRMAWINYLYVHLINRFTYGCYVAILCIQTKNLAVIYPAHRNAKKKMQMGTQRLYTFTACIIFHISQFSFCPPI